MSLTNQHIAILGGGRSGLAAAALALREGAEVVILDTVDGAGADALCARCAALSPDLQVVTGAAAMSAPARKFDLLVTSPGISLVDGWGAMMAATATTAIGEIEFAWKYFHGRTIGITGTNGKTTTTEMIRDVLLAAGHKAVAAGNHGMPLAEVVMQHPEIEWVALELSSFQLETIAAYRPDVAVWLNFAPDHMDRYHSLEEYHTAKLRLFLNLDANGTAIVPAEEAAAIDCHGARVETFSTVDTTARWHLADGMICRDQHRLMAVEDVAVRGRHNHANLLAAWAAAHAAGAGDDAARAVFQSFKPPLNRYEWIARANGVDFINDSKSTNLHSLETALHAEDRLYVLIAGGKDKGLDFHDVAATVAKRCRAVIAIGEIRPHLRSAFASMVDFHEAADLEDAVAQARALAHTGDAVLLSPGTSSFDMFRDYAHRGEIFRQVIQANVSMQTTEPAL